MPESRDWTLKEVAAIVDDYFDMLRLELQNREYNKAEHRRALLPNLDRRSHGSVEMKRCNISAALSDLGLVYIRGYKPRSNKQYLLVEETKRYLVRHPDLAVERS